MTGDFKEAVLFDCPFCGAQCVAGFVELVHARDAIAEYISEPRIVFHDIDPCSNYLRLGADAFFEHCQAVRSGCAS